MEVFSWLTNHWFELAQTLGIIATLAYTAYTVRQDDKGRKIANLLAINERYGAIWKERYVRPELSRLFEREVDLKEHPVQDHEYLFVKMLILHLDSVRRAIELGVFVELEGLQKDIREFFALPIPKAVWERLKPWQDAEFIAFVEGAS